MKPSLNEIQVECKKASRGAGLSWGLAEEVGQAMARLAGQGVDALPVLLDYLEALPDRDMSGDPIRAGTWIADQANLLAEGESLSFAEIRQPMLVLPFVAMAAQSIGRPIIVTHRDGAWTVPSAGMPAQDLSGIEILQGVTCTAAAAKVDIASPVSMPRLDIDDLIWQRLKDLAQRTYVPATEQSRLLGAGAGSIDND
ncbi:MAG: DUF3726 domain-containing protein [Rhodospirillaceae bacterium]|nr:MAG: DUF3726 domain-containing protein [Rhodospirillaceae bacterium]